MRAATLGKNDPQCGTTMCALGKRAGTSCAIMLSTARVVSAKNS
jgi:hypothetical protein